MERENMMTIVEIKKPVCPPYATERTRARWTAWATWDGYGRRPGYPAAALAADDILRAREGGR